MIGAALGLMLFAPAAGPVPAGPPAKAGGADRDEARELALRVFQLAEQIPSQYTPRPVTVPELMEAAARGLYEEAGQQLPEATRRAVRNAGGTDGLVLALADARMALGRHPALEGSKALFAAVGGFRHALDPYCGIAGGQSNYVSADVEFGVGLELDGVTGLRWAMYAGNGQFTPASRRVPGPAAVLPKFPEPPATYPWTVKKVVPGSPAHKAGVLPGDVITHLNGTAVDPATAPKLFAEFAAGRGIGADVKWMFRLRRAGRPDPLTVSVHVEPYTPECVFGVVRRPDGGWDHMLDVENRIGYVRLGALERQAGPNLLGADGQLTEALSELKRRHCRGLVLDLRWCPGGYVNQAVLVAGMFLPDGAVIYRDDSRPRPGYENRPVIRVGEEEKKGGEPFKFEDVPVVVLVGSATLGGGELLAAALQDNKRAVVIGQRTVGKAAITTIVNDPLGALHYRVTTGTTLRPNGKSRHRRPDSGPNDDWGICPDPGHAVPVTADFTAELGRWADRQVLRPAASREVLPFDDPARDPFRVAALAYFREKLK